MSNHITTTGDKPVPGVVSPVHYVSECKNGDQKWGEWLLDRGERKIYRGQELETIAMPCGGIGAGQLYVRGDGTLSQWWIDNAGYETGYGQPGTATTPMGTYPVGYMVTPSRSPSPVDQGFAVWVRGGGNQPVIRRLSRADFDDIGFIGEYPIAEILYHTKEKQPLLVDIMGKIFSPWIPLNVRDSANPATIVQYTVRNSSGTPVDVAIAGWLQNLVLMGQEGASELHRRNRIIHGEGLVGVAMDTVALADHPPLPGNPRQGDMALVSLDQNAKAISNFTSIEDLFNRFFSGPTIIDRETQCLLKEKLTGAIVSSFSLKPGETKTVNFVITWFFPNRKLVTPNQYPENGTTVGNMYSNWFSSAWDVAEYISHNFLRLCRDTQLFRDTYFDTTLPYWFIHRINMPTSTLATETVNWWRNGRFWGWEGVGTCLGTCGHVYNFAQSIAKLFPELERSVRQMQDLGTNAFDEATGRIDYRGGSSDTWKVTENTWGYAADAQAGYVLKLYREHLMSANGTFLDQVWPKAKKVIGYLIERDAAGTDSINRRADLSQADGVIEDTQHTTWDSNLHGPNSYIETWYLAALRAAEEMARLKKENILADRYRNLYESGRTFTLGNLWNGEYFTHIQPGKLPIEPSLTPSIEYGNGCLSNQLVGQAWASQLGLGELYPHDMIVSTLRSIFHYNWTPDVGYDKAYPEVGPRHKEYPKIRLFALSGEPGLFECTWPHGNPPANPLLHNAEVFTGTEYQVAGLMLQEGLIQEGLMLVRSIHDRYDGIKRNPWNEIECGDHYARAMASWGCLTGVCGYEYDGPAGKIGFFPRLTPDNFKCFFSAAQGWGSLVQYRESGKQTNKIDLKWGCLGFKTIALELPEGMTPKTVVASIEKKQLRHTVECDGKKIIITMAKHQTIKAGRSLNIEMFFPLSDPAH